MDVSGERVIAAPREQVWAALNDLDLVRKCIAGCESIEKGPGKELQAVVAVKLGPIDARFSAKLLVLGIDPLNGCTLAGEVQSAIAGYAEARGSVELYDTDGGTALSYYVNAKVGGRIAQLSAPLITSTTTQMVDSFLMKLSDAVTPPAAAEPTKPGAPAPDASPYHNLQEDHDHDPSNPHYFGLPIGVIIAATIAAISVGITLLKFILH